MNEREILLYNSLENLHLLNMTEKTTVLHDLMGLQAQFADNPRISLKLRAVDYADSSWGDGLIKIWSHRGTMHVIHEDELPLHLAAADNHGDYEDGWWGMTAEQMHRWEPFLIAEILSGNDTRDGLKAAAEAAGMEEELKRSVFYGWGGLLKELCWRGKIAGKTGLTKAYMIPREFSMPARDDARMEFLRRYFTHFGPATREDCLNFFQKKRNEMNPLLDQVLNECQCTVIDGKKYYHVKPLKTEGEIPACVLVPGFDQLVLGYKDRLRMIDEENKRKLVNVAGIVFPAVIVRNRIRAAWKAEGDRIRVMPFERLLKKDIAAITRAAKKAGFKEITAAG